MNPRAHGAYVEQQRSYWARRDEEHFRFQTETPYIADTEAALLEAVRPAPGERLLEIGCGEGGNLYHIGRRCPGARLYGLDFSPDKAAFAARALRQAGVPAHALAADAARLPLPDGSFDVVLVRDLLHHLPDRGAPLAEAYRVLRPGGRLVLIEPNRRSPLVLLQMALVPAERGAWRSTAAGLARELATAGFRPFCDFAAQPLPISRVVLHHRLMDLAARLGAPGLGSRPLVHEALRRAEALLGLILPRSFWLYLCYIAVRPEAGPQGR